MMLGRLMFLLGCALPVWAEDPVPAVLLKGSLATELAPHGTGNVYAPEIHRDGARWLMWYGGQGKDGHDRIHLAESGDGVAWTKRGAVLDCGEANHVNDPSVVRTGGVWWMFYTVAAKGEQDEIAAATSMDGVKWEKKQVVLKPGADNAWDSAKVGRPSVLHENGVFRMWYDGQPRPDAAAGNELAARVKREGRAIGLAESTDGLTWKRRESPVFFEGAGAVQVLPRRSGYAMVIEGGRGVSWAESSDGTVWKSRGLLHAAGASPAERFGCVTPFVLVNGAATQLFYGAASRPTWDGNTIAAVAVTLPEKE